MKKKTAASRKSSAGFAGRKLTCLLVPIDFSPASQQALGLAVPLAKQFGAKLILLHVIEPAAYPAEFGYLAMDNDDLARTARGRLEQLARKSVPRGLVERVVVRTGRAFQEITSAARTLRADLIVLTTRGRTGLKHALLGSTAERVVRHAACPVLVVR
jgi:universal stress protein A